MENTKGFVSRSGRFGAPSHRESTAGFGWRELLMLLFLVALTVVGSLGCSSDDAGLAGEPTQESPPAALSCPSGFYRDARGCVDDAATAFSDSNPGGNWWYAERPEGGLAASAFTVFGPWNAQLQKWTSNADERAGFVAHNRTEGWLAFRDTFVPPHGLAVQPGAGVRTLVGWEAPVAGRYHVTGAFTGLGIVSKNTMTIVRAIVEHSHGNAFDSRVDYWLNVAGHPNTTSFDFEVSGKTQLWFEVEGDPGRGLTALEALITYIGA